MLIAYCFVEEGNLVQRIKTPVLLVGLPYLAISIANSIGAEKVYQGLIDKKTLIATGILAGGMLAYKAGKSALELIFDNYGGPYAIY